METVELSNPAETSVQHQTINNIIKQIDDVTQDIQNLSQKQGQIGGRKQKKLHSKHNKKFNIISDEIRRNNGNIYVIDGFFIPENFCF